MNCDYTITMFKPRRSCACRPSWRWCRRWRRWRAFYVSYTIFKT